MFLFPCFFVVSNSAIDCLERLVSKITYYASSGTLNHTHSHIVRATTIVTKALHTVVLNDYSACTCSCFTLRNKLAVEFV